MTASDNRLEIDELLIIRQLSIRMGFGDLRNPDFGFPNPTILSMIS